jgi:hypothetical protein
MQTALSFAPDAAAASPTERLIPAWAFHFGSATASPLQWVTLHPPMN